MGRMGYFSRRSVCRLFYISVVAVFLLFCVGWWFVLPSPLFDTPYSTVLLDRENRTIGLKVARDDQFRFPEGSFLSAKYVQALLTFEDKRFFYHRGVDWLALCRAVYQNFSSSMVVSGGSTLSMQVIRLCRKNPPLYDLYS